MGGILGLSTYTVLSSAMALDTVGFDYLFTNLPYRWSWAQNVASRFSVNICWLELEGLSGLQPIAKQQQGRDGGHWCSGMFHSLSCTLQGLTLTLWPTGVLEIKVILAGVSSDRCNQWRKRPASSGIWTRGCLWCRGLPYLRGEAAPTQCWLISFRSSILIKIFLFWGKGKFTHSCKK